MIPFAPDFLAGKRALVTGGGTGIGRAIALALAEHGADVAVAARRVELLEKTRADVEARGRKGLAIACDIRDPERVEAVVDEIWKAWGRIDILVNNAGGNFVCPAVRMTPKGWRAVIDTNLNGTFYVTRAVGDRMLADSGGGRIIMISATNGEMGSPLIAHSGASKAGINNLAQTLAVEWASGGVLVNVVSPGPVRSEGSDERIWTDPDVVQRITARVPLGRIANPGDIIGSVLFLASPAAAFVTGAILHVDGGERLRNPRELG